MLIKYVFYNGKTNICNYGSLRDGIIAMQAEIWSKSFCVT